MVKQILLGIILVCALFIRGYAQVEQLVQSKNWQCSKDLGQVKSSDTISFVGNLEELHANIRLLANNRIECQVNHHDCIKKISIDDHKTMHVLKNNYAWTDKGNWLYENNLLTLFMPNNKVVLHIISVSENQIIMDVVSQSNLISSIF